LFTQRIDASQETRLSASLDEVNKWINARRAKAQEESMRPEAEQGLPPLVDEAEPTEQESKGKEKQTAAKTGSCSSHVLFV
jgi:hypothetical protein